MITKQEKQIICELAEKYHVGRLLLFGSSSLADELYGDIDLAVEGLPQASFFRFYSELMLSLSKPIDLVDLSSPNGFSRLIAKEGVPIYG